MLQLIGKLHEREIDFAFDFVDIDLNVLVISSVVIVVFEVVSELLKCRLVVRRGDEMEWFSKFFEYFLGSVFVGLPFCLVGVKCVKDLHDEGIY